MAWGERFKVAVIANLDGVGFELAPHEDDVPLVGSSRVESARKVFNEAFQKHVNTTKEDWRVFPEVKEEPHFRFRVSLFPEHDSVYLVGLSVGFPLSEFSKKDNSQITNIVRTIVVYRNPNSLTSSVVAQDITTVPYPSTINPEVAAYQYWSTLLPKDDYQLSISLKNPDGTILGIKQYSFKIPSAVSSKATSDVLLTMNPAQPAQTGIPRNGKLLRGVAYNIFNEGDTLYLYVESDLSENGFKSYDRGMYEYLARAFFLGPLKGDEREGEVTVGPVLTVESERSGKSNEKRGFRTKLDEKESLVAPSAGTSSSRLVYVGKTVVPKGLKGSYYIRITVEDKNSAASIHSATIVNFK
jgi:hypothetical protein